MGKLKQNQTINNRTDFFYYAFRNILLVGLPLVIVCGLVLSHLSFHSSAYSSSTDNVSLTLPSACTISASVVEQHNATLVNGQKEDNIGNTKINAYCNDNNGYFIYAIGSSGDIDGNTDLISSINNNYNIHTGVYSIGNTNSSWAMKLSSNNGTYAPTIIDGYDSYSLIPETDTIVAFRTSGTSMDINTDLTGSYFNTTYQIYANSIQPAGTYLGKVKYTMTHPYDASQLTTIEKAFDIAGKDKVTVTDPVTGITGSYYKMQDMSSRICDLTTAHNELSETQLVDIRDNKVYWVAKLDDGHCWMTQNLDLDINSDTSSENYIALTSENTNLETYGPNGYDSDNGYTCSNALTTTNCTANNEVISWVPERSTITQNSLNSSTWVNDNNNPYSYDRGMIYPDSYEQEATAGSHGLVGNYYNWTAAIASNNSSNYINSGIADNSICSKGWRLPNAAPVEKGYEFSKLLYTYNITMDSNNTAGYANNNSFDKMVSSPLWFVRSGRVDSGQLYNSGYDSSYWSSAVSNNSNSYYLYFVDNTVTPAVNYLRYRGWSVRCVAR